MMRALALGHFAWSLLLALLAAGLALSFFRALAHMSTGTVWSNLCRALTTVSMTAMPLALLGGWLFVLGRRVWRGDQSLRTALLVTHGILLAFGVLNLVIGGYAVRAAEISTAHGGGIMSPLAWIPVICGLFLSALALPSIILALTSATRHPPSLK